MRLFLIIFLYAGKSNDSVRDNIIGAVPIGFSSVNKEENDNKINDIIETFEVIETARTL